MNKSQFTQKYANDFHLPTHKAHQIIEAVLSKMSEALIDGDRIELRGFGTFSVREFGKKRGRNPKTGETIEIENSKRLYFRPGKLVRTSLIKSKEAGVAIQKE